MSDFYAGVELRDESPGAAIVTDQPAATCFLVGTAPEGAANSAVLIRSRQEAAAAFGAHAPGFTIPAALDAIFDQAGPDGVGTIEVVNVFDKARHASPGDVQNTDIIGQIAPDGSATGLKCAYTSYQKFGRFCKFLIAPGFANLPGVRAELETICERVRARAILDAPVGMLAQDIIEARGPEGDFNWQFNNRRLVLAWPHMKIVDPQSGEVRLDSYAARLAGVWLSSIMRYGYHHSPSNRPIMGIEDTEVPVTYIPGDKQSQTQLLRAAGVVTIEERHGKGPHVSGNRSSAYPTDTDMRNFLHAQLIEDMIDEAILHYLDQLRDRNLNPARVELAEEAVNDWLKSKMVGDDPVFSGAEFRFDRQRTTAAQIANGRSYFQLKWAPIGIMERITVLRDLDINLLGNPFALSEGSS